jgi:hypothetical protein
MSNQDFHGSGREKRKRSESEAKALPQRDQDYALRTLIVLFTGEAVA